MILLLTILWLERPYDKAWIETAYDHLPQYTREIEACHKLIVKEAPGGVPSRHAQNGGSTAYGLGQFLNSTWKGTNIKKTSDGVKQISAMIIYCHNRYGGVAKALKAHYVKGWYMNMNTDVRLLLHQNFGAISIGNRASGGGPPQSPTIGGTAGLRWSQAGLGGHYGWPGAVVLGGVG